MTREDAIDVLRHNYPSACFEDLCDAVETAIQALSAQPEIVRCKDCKHFNRYIPCVGGTYNGCDQLEGRDGCEPYVEEDFFCAYGERRSDATGI